MAQHVALWVTRNGQHLWSGPYPSKVRAADALASVLAPLETGQGFVGTLQWQDVSVSEGWGECQGCGGYYRLTKDAGVVRRHGWHQQADGTFGYCAGSRLPPNQEDSDD